MLVYRAGATWSRLFLPGANPLLVGAKVSSGTTDFQSRSHQKKCGGSATLLTKSQEQINKSKRSEQYCILAKTKAVASLTTPNCTGQDGVKKMKYLILHE